MDVKIIKNLHAKYEAIFCRDRDSNSGDPLGVTLQACSKPLEHLSMADFPVGKGLPDEWDCKYRIFLNIEKSLSVSGGNFRRRSGGVPGGVPAAIRLAFQVAIREPNRNRAHRSASGGSPGTKTRKSCPRSASGGYPDTKSRETVPAAPPLTMVWKGRRVFGGLGRGGLFSGRRALERAAFQPFDVAIDPEQFPGNIDALRAVRDALLAGCAV